jgi:hypothetical protein
VKKVAEGEKGAGTGVNPSAGVNALKTTYQGIQKIFEHAEHERHRDHAEEVLSELVRKEIQPLEGDGFLDYAEDYDDFTLLLEWWDYDDDGTYSCQGTLQYFLKYYDYKTGKYYSDDELGAQVEKVRKDILRREKEREEWGKEIQKRMEEAEKNE